ncbi:hypothetical protein AgCh_037962 [Apium graveolens]
MGITGELVRSVFSKSRSIRTHETSEDSASVGSSKVTVSAQPEFSSVAEGNPSSSVWSSEATITQPVPLGLIDAVDAESRQTNGDMHEKQNSTSRLINKDDAATIIQLAFRSFQARRTIEGLKLTDGNDNPTVGAESRRSGSTGTSIEFQTGNTTGVHSLRDKIEKMPQPLQIKGRRQGLKLKEDWNDSTVSSDILKLRMQNRLEATTRRERALAYAFSQQLRVCSKKKHSRSKSDVVESNMGWSWLERWMATRQKENCLLDITKQNEPPNSNQISDTGDQQRLCNGG